MNILHISSSPRKDHSKSRRLGAAIVEQLLAAHPGATIIHKDLALHPLPHLDHTHLMAFYAPEQYRLPGHDEAVRPSDEAIAEIFAADVLVVEAPLYNLTISSTLKAWIDHIVRGDVTFAHTPNGDVGLVTGKKVYVAVTAGNLYADAHSPNFVTPLLRAVFGMLGMTDVSFFMADGLNVPGVKEDSLKRAIDGIRL
jgi:FMN-dependent NADH-azoreductase